MFEGYKEDEIMHNNEVGVNLTGTGPLIRWLLFSLFNFYLRYINISKIIKISTTGLG